MKGRLSGSWQLVLMLLVLGSVAGLTSIFLPISRASWLEVLGISSSVESFSRLEPEPQDCTYPLDYWLRHGERLPGEAFQAGNEQYDRVTTRAILGIEAGQDYRLVLEQQLLLARVNIQNGADPAEIAATLALADAYLAAQPPDSELDYTLQKQAYTLAVTLQAYNYGQIGPGVCPDWYTDGPIADLPTAAPIAATPVPTSAPTETPTPTATATQWVLPTRTSTATATATITPVPTNTPYATASVTPVPVFTHTPTALMIGTPVVPSQTASPTTTGLPSATVTPAALVCIHTAEYWRSSPEAWPALHLSLGSLELGPEEALIILQTKAEGQLNYLLAHQLLATQLNLANGGDPEQIVAVTLQAGLWFDRYGLEREPDPLHRKLGYALVDALEQYNLGPGTCLAVTPSATLTPSATVSDTATAPPIETQEIPVVTGTPSSTALPPSPTASVTTTAEPTPTATDAPATSPSQPPPAVTLIIGPTPTPAPP